MAVLAEDFEVIPRLEQLGLAKAALLDVVRAAVGGRRNSTGFHPLSAGGLLSWIEGTAHLRRVFVPQGWEICRRDNIESIFSPEIGIKVVFQNAERAGDPLHDPIATSKKGAGSAYSSPIQSIGVNGERSTNAAAARDPSQSAERSRRSPAGRFPT